MPTERRWVCWPKTQSEYELTALQGLLQCGTAFDSFWGVQSVSTLRNPLARLILHLLSTLDRAFRYLAQPTRHSLLLDYRG